MQNLKKLRIESNLTLRALGDLLGMGNSTLSMYESGTRQPDHETLKKIADYFGVSIDYILAHGLSQNFTLYQMRHFFGNANKRNGVDRFTTATLMGHADASVTERYYYAEDKILSQKATNKIIDSFFKAQSSDN